MHSKSSNRLKGVGNAWFNLSFYCLDTAPMNQIKMIQDIYRLRQVLPLDTLFINHQRKSIPRSIGGLFRLFQTLQMMLTQGETVFITK
jgi:hypothetical protein